MSQANKNWPRWLFASVSEHFENNKGALTLFIEGQHRKTRDLKDFAELRVDGPYLTEVCKGVWRIFIEVNVLVQSAMDDANFHRIHTNVGIIVAAFTSIPVYKYGTGVDDDESLLGCLTIVSDARGKERIQVSHFGKIDAATPLEQATVEGHYEMFLTV
jgi:hypothetical protein